MKSFTYHHSILILSLLAAVFHGGRLQAGEESLAPLLTLPAMNVFRRHSVPVETMYEFYGAVLGLEQLQTYAVGDGAVSRFQVGASQLKFSAVENRRRYVGGGVRAATGLRLISFFFPDRKELEARFRAQGLALPDFQKHGSGLRALVEDPDGQLVELVVESGREEAFYRQVEIGLTVSDLDLSREFYGRFVGLEALPPVFDSLFGTMKYSFRHGSTLVSLRSFGAGLPADTGSGGIQYVVSDGEKVAALAKARDVVIDQPLSGLDGYALRLIWLDDPDGITNYFAEPGGR